MSLTFRPIPALVGQSSSIPLGLNNRGWAPVTLFLAGTVATALAFACTATYARKERVTGYLTPREGVARVSVPKSGIVTELFVKDGDLVKEGDALLAIDTRQALAGGSTLDAIISDNLRQQLGLIDKQISAEQARAKSEDDRLSARIQSLTAERTNLDVQHSLQVDRAAVTEARLKALSELRTKGYVSEAEYRAQEDAWLSQRQNLAAIDQRITSLDADLAQVRFERAKGPLDSADRQAQLVASQAELKQRLAEADAQGRQLIKAPKEGRVTALQAATGQRVDPARPVVTLAPSEATMLAELYIPSRAIGFIKPGRRVRIMYDAFPSQHFGTYEGTVETVSETVFAPREAVGPNQPVEPSYLAMVRLESRTINAYGNIIQLKVDMSVTAEIILEKNSLLSWVLEPLIRFKK